MGNETSKKKERHLMAKEGMEAISALEETVKMENVIKDNKIVFDSGGKAFRVRKPTLSEQQQIDDIRRTKYGELVRDDSFMFRKQWIEIYKKKGIDINKMEDNIRQVQEDLKSILLRLAKTSEAKSVKLLTDEVKKIKDKLYDLAIEKTDLLVYSIEDQLLIHINSYTTYVVLEKKDEAKGKFQKVFKSYKEFEESKNEELIGKAFYFLNILMYGTK